MAVRDDDQLERLVLTHFYFARLPDPPAAAVETPHGEPRGASLLEASPSLFLERFGARFRRCSDFSGGCQDLASRRRPAGFPAGRLYSGWHRYRDLSQSDK